MIDFSKSKRWFQLPKDSIYLNGNSLGPMPKNLPHRLQRTLTDEWGEKLIAAWNDAGWMEQPLRVGEQICPLIGAESGQVIAGDTLSIQLFQALSAALNLRPNRKVILSEIGNFPSDLYIAAGLVRLLDRDYELRLVPTEEISENISSEVAVLMLTEVDYRTGRRHNMQALTRLAHDVGALTVWDLAHSVGAIPVDVEAANVDFAVGCTYKYLNAGPGAPAFIYVAAPHCDRIEPTLAGWLGHQAPFDFEQNYRAANGIARMRIGTPPVLQMTALECALEIWQHANIHDVYRKSCELTEQFMAGVKTKCPELSLVTPINASERGSHVAFRFSEGYAVIQALKARGVIGDFRAPDLMRFGIAPLYNDAADIVRAIDNIAEIITNKLWDKAAYKKRQLVT
ncbi:MAG: kynureninase [Aestuariivita sp.]|nr:kynureninase [Aestuariivita sp.]MCY4201164.1 kynureninase [Aestuariivita sp.]